MTKPTAHVPAPALELRDGTPVSTVFDDVYFSPAGGMAETEYVFLQGNGLPDRWLDANSGAGDYLCVAEGEPRSGGSSRAKGPRQHQFFIAELGFGTGLNFLVTMKRFRETAEAQARLHYIVIEKYPFTPEQLRALLTQQPKLASEAEELIAAYPLRLPGVHRVHLGNVSLTLCFGDVAKMLEQLDISRGPFAPYATLTPAASGSPSATRAQGEVSGGGINAWYLDGFSPAKNSEMWAPEIFEQMARLSAPNATFATFTAASHVRRGLEMAGFTVHKSKGFGHKREMSCGVYEGGIAPFVPSDTDPFPSGSLTLLTHNHRPSSKPCVAEGESRAAGVNVSGRVGGKAPFNNILVIGAGIAGATLARALAVRGYGVTVLERGTVASGASGNEAGVLFPQITKQWSSASDWYFTAYSYALSQIRHWQAQGLTFEHAQCGMLRLPRHADEEILLQQLDKTHGLDASIVHWLARDVASAQAGVPLETGAAFFPKGTWLNPQQLCAALLQHENITVREQTTVESLARMGEKWRLIMGKGEVMETEHCCMTAAHESAALLGNYGIKLGTVGGQVSMFNADDAAPALRSILCHSGYVIPLTSQRVAEGEPRAAGVSDNVAKGTRSPSINSYLVGATYHREEMLGVSAARHDENRASLNEILPDWMRSDAVAGRSSMRATTPDRLPYVGMVDAGLYVSTGHGSRGLLSAPLAAEMIASAIAGEAMPVSAALQHITRPHRFKKAVALVHPQSLHA